MEYIDIAQVKRLNQEKGKFFFTKGATSFFQSRYPTMALREGDKAYFVTSEQFISSQGEREPRLYTIRLCDMKTGDIDTVGEFQQYQNSSQAYKAIKMRFE